eukprot:8701003-Lingulodinium_polyedra.AAC.1
MGQDGIAGTRALADVAGNGKRYHAGAPVKPRRAGTSRLAAQLATRPMWGPCAQSKSLARA